MAPEGWEGAIDELRRKAEILLEKLGLHYRTTLLAAQDASASMAARVAPDRFGGLVGSAPDRLRAFDFLFPVTIW